MNTIADIEKVKSLIQRDEYGTVLNRPKTYEGLVKILTTYGRVVIAWTDEEGTQLDILITYRPFQFGHLQRGMDTVTDLFVGVSSFGFFGFELNGQEKHPSYVGEKLGLGRESSTTAKVAELINELCKRLEKL